MVAPPLSRILAALAALALLVATAAARAEAPFAGTYVKDDRSTDEIIGRTARLEVTDLGDGRLALALSIGNPALCGGAYSGEAQVNGDSASFEDLGCRLDLTFAADRVRIEEAPAPCMTDQCPLAGDYYRLGTPAPATEQEAVARIREHYAFINSRLDEFMSVHKELQGFSTEGGSMTAWYAYDDYLKKIAATFYGETGKSEEEYYFWDNELVFCFQALTRYAEPFGQPESEEENRWYFRNGVMIRWIGPDGQRVPETAGEYAPTARRVLETAARLAAGATGSGAVVSGSGGAGE